MRLWDTRTGMELRILPGPSYKRVRFSPDGQLLLAAGADGILRLWNMRVPDTFVRVLHGHQNDVRGFAVSPDSKLLASASYDHTVRLWDIASGKELHILRVPPKMTIFLLQFSRDGSEIYADGINSGDALKEKHGWKVADGEKCPVPAALLKKFDPAQSSVTPDGRWAISYVDKSILLVRHTPSKDEIEFRTFAFHSFLPWNEAQIRRAAAEKDHFALSCQLGQYFAARKRMELMPWDPIPPASLVGACPQPLFGLASWTGLTEGRRAAAVFVDGPTFAGILLKDSGLSTKGMVVRAQATLNASTTSPDNRELLGAALFRDGDAKGAIRELTFRPNSEPSLLTCHFLALAQAKLGNKDEARKWLDKTSPLKNRDWFNTLVDRIVRPEVEIALKSNKPK